MSKIHVPDNGQAYFVCPGCTAYAGYWQVHAVSIDPARARQMRDGSKPCWSFNRDVERPTLAPSVNYPDWCHFFVRDGQIEYQGDCKHGMAGQTVELPEWTGFPGGQQL